MARQSKRCRCHVAGVKFSLASRIFDYPREVNSFSINLRIATFSEITRKTWCAESSMGENFDATMRANELRPREKLRIHVANSRFGPRSNQRRKFFATYIYIYRGWNFTFSCDIMKARYFYVAQYKRSMFFCLCGVTYRDTRTEIIS